jgi:hypothetical protein
MSNFFFPFQILFQHIRQVTVGRVIGKSLCTSKASKVSTIFFSVLQTLGHFCGLFGRRATSCVLQL